MMGFFHRRRRRRRLPRRRHGHHRHSMTWRRRARSGFIMDYRFTDHRDFDRQEEARRRPRARWQPRP